LIWQILLKTLAFTTQAFRLDGALGGSFWFYFWLSSLYRVKGCYVVKASLPLHPFENELDSYKFHRLTPAPNTQSNSKVPFACASCRSVFKAGVKYKYNKEEGRKTKYCFKCADAIHEKNEALEKERAKQMSRRPEMLEEVNKYYAKHAKATV
jgi:hypothetical protein